jgi:hypothetical protein
MPMRQIGAAFAVVVIAVAMAEPALAIPAFARRYKVACHFCHEGYPKLNAIGQRFRERGFRMEREDAFDGAGWLRSVPLTGRVHANRSFVEDEEGVSTGFFKAVSAGNLGRRLSYWVDDALVDNFDRPNREERNHVEPDNAWLRLEVVAGGKLYARVGRMELDLPFTQTRTSHLFPYEIYFANTGFERDSIGEYQDGFEIGGELPQDVRWTVAVVKGRNSDEATELSDDAGQFDANFYFRLAKRIGRHRVGALAYLGRNTLARSLAPAPGAPAIRPAEWEDQLLRLGADASVWVRRFHLYGVFLYGRNDNSLADAARPGGTGERLSFAGGFLQGDYHLRGEVALTLRLNAVNRPPDGTSLPRETFLSVFPGLQVFLIQDHLKLSFEYGFQNQDRRNRGAIQAEVAF